ncbi:Stealth CR1 domain-containing protein [Alistipes sp. OttesenSCG-928-B03]|nr:Stealth CR1 domain-containing protein [Alistipes sp. OttesenSCG-928-B03]
MSNEPIDVVIAWVDGDDPAHREKMRRYVKAKQESNESVAAPTRFRQVGEIFYCVASVLRFAPFVRKIFILTDGQNPQLDEFVDKHFPDRTTQIEIVDHKEAFRGYEKHLPVFNALSIETVVYAIPGLAENFVYMNDDFMLARPVAPEEWFFGDGQFVARGRWRRQALFRLVSSLRPGDCSFKDCLMSAAQKAGLKSRFLLISHTPHAQKKSLLEKFYAQHPDVPEANLSHRFRHKSQYNPQALCYVLGLQSGVCRLDSDRELYMKPVGRGDGYVSKKIGEFNRNRPMSICVQSLDMATEADQRQVAAWLDGILGIDVKG